jgi:hypothetical protein
LFKKVQPPARILVPLLIGGVALALDMSPAYALSVTVPVGGVDYLVTTFEGSYESNASKFATPANGGLMPWWGDQFLAKQFAASLATIQTTTNPFFGFVFRPSQVQGFLGPLIYLPTILTLIPL